MIRGLLLLKKNHGKRRGGKEGGERRKDGEREGDAHLLLALHHGVIKHEGLNRRNTLNLFSHPPGL